MSDPDRLVPDAMAGVRGVRLLGGCDNYTAASSGGAEKAAHEIYLRLGAAGMDVRVVSVPFGVPYDDPGVQVVPARGLDLSRLAGGYVALSPGTYRRIGQQHAAFRPAVLHANTIHYNSSLALARLARRSGLPFVLTAQVGPMTEMPFVTRASARAYDGSAGRYIVRRATRVLAVSAAVRDHMVDLGAEPARVSIVENGVDHERFACPALTAHDDPLVVAVGRLVENKGPQLLVEAASMLARRGVRCRVAFVGDGPLRSSLAARVTASGLDDRVTFTGHVPDVERWLRQADIVVRPSFSEGLSLAVLEAMSAGRLNVVSDIAPNRELITSDVTGLTFRTGDAGDLARQLERVLVDPALRVRLAGAGQRASRTRSWDRMAAETAAALLGAVRA